jgi:hypothetical protein
MLAQPMLTCPCHSCAAAVTAWSGHQAASLVVVETTLGSSTGWEVSKGHRAGVASSDACMGRCTRIFLVLVRSCMAALATIRRCFWHYQPQSRWTTTTSRWAVCAITKVVGCRSRSLLMRHVRPSSLWGLLCFPCSCLHPRLGLDAAACACTRSC